MNRSSDKTQAPARILLVGGLGNQLFGFFAGRYLSKVIGTPVEYIQTGAPLHFSGLRSSLSDLRTSGTDLISTSPLHLLGSKLSRRLSGVLPFPVSRQLAKILPETFVASGIGFDNQLAHVEPGSYVQGYFQTYKYFRRLEEVEGVVKCELKAQSSWYKEMRRRMERADPIVMHIRRGDYRKLSTSFGLLGDRYYVKALDTLGDRELARPIWIFSDEAMPMNEQFLLVEGREFVWVNQKGAQSAAEVLFLMAQARTSIISNSTFAWWSALLGEEKTVVAPTKWFKCEEDPEELLPANWLRAESSWE